MMQLEVNKEGMNGIVPSRRYKHGPRPGISRFKEDPEAEKWRWTRDPNGLTEAEKRTVLAAVIKVMVLTTFNNHYYRWNGVTRRQTKGAAMGLRAFGCVSRICTDIWMKEFIRKLE